MTKRSSYLCPEIADFEIYFEIIRKFSRLISLIIFNIIIRYEVILMCTLINVAKLISLCYKHVVNVEDLKV